ncbi:2OG-Fe(II) oxygenase [Aquabacterium sp.]|uniref:2OG-Fe(II) oxygenase n=1 Tax=Aquabacterium sp. TaxID=1872578 RepID=UPI0037850060
MPDVAEQVAALDWAAVTRQLDDEGHALLPGLLQDAAALPALRDALYPRLLPIAHRWQALLGEPPTPWPAACPHPAQPMTSCLRAGDYQPLHQHAGDPQAFPLQLLALLSEPGRDFDGGECVLTEQRPRLQSRPIVLPLRRGDIALIALAQRPQRGAAGHYRVNLKHAISRVHRGERLGLELLFHAG